VDTRFTTTTAAANGRAGGRMTMHRRREREALRQAVASTAISATMAALDSLAEIAASLETLRAG